VNVMKGARKFSKTPMGVVFSKTSLTYERIRKRHGVAHMKRCVVLKYLDASPDT